MRRADIHVLGASGSGTTTLGRAVAAATAAPHNDVDDYFWLPTDPPYTTQRPVEERLRLMRELFVPRADWVLSGSLGSWGAELVALFERVVFVAVPAEVRMARLNRLEAIRHGPAAVAPGGHLHAAHMAFLDWASHYDDATFPGRNRARHEAFLASLACPVLRLDGERPIGCNVGHVVALLEARADDPGPRARA